MDDLNPRIPVQTGWKPIGLDSHFNVFPERAASVPEANLKFVAAVSPGVIPVVDLDRGEVFDRPHAARGVLQAERRDLADAFPERTRKANEAEGL